MASRRPDVRSIYDRRFGAEDRREKDAIWKVIVEKHLQRWVAPSDVVLDVGCGFGEFLNHIRCARKVGVDLNPESKRALDPSVEFHVAEASKLPMVADASVNVAFTSNFMEHLPSKAAVEQMIAEVFRVLAPSGSFIALGPNVRFIPGSYWDFWDHYVPISDRSLAELLETSGFRVTDCHPRFLPYTTRSSLPKAPWLVGLYLKVPLVWRLLGAQFLIRARKE
jgi:ubiquinone/menaquinone biosynthesis C-methylase UbiE